MSPDIHLRRSPYERDDEDEHKEEGYNSQIEQTIDGTVIAHDEPRVYQIEDLIKLQQSFLESQGRNFDSNLSSEIHRLLKSNEKINGQNQIEIIQGGPSPTIQQSALITTQKASLFNRSQGTPVQSTLRRNNSIKHKNSNLVGNDDSGKYIHHQRASSRYQTQTEIPTSLQPLHWDHPHPNFASRSGLNATKIISSPGDGGAPDLFEPKSQKAGGATGGHLPSQGSVKDYSSIILAHEQMKRKQSLEASPLGKQNSQPYLTHRVIPNADDLRESI